MPKQPDALAVAIAVYESRTRAEAAKRLKVSERTVYTYLQNYEVQAAIRALYAEMITESAKRLYSLQGLALDVIQQTLQDQSAKTADRLKAAGIVLTMGRDALRDAEQATETACNALRDAAEHEASRIISYNFGGDDYL